MHGKCVYFVLIIYITGGIFMNNQWAMYGPQPGMAYVNQPQQNGCCMYPMQVNPEEENNKIIRQTALCCTVAVLVGVGVGMMIENNRHNHDDNNCRSAFL